MDKLLKELNNLKNNLLELNTENISNLNLSKTILFIVDMNNGFAKEGLLYSPRVENLIKPIENFSKHICSELNLSLIHI